jgi:hypothetical protein
MPKKERTEVVIVREHPMHVPVSKKNRATTLIQVIRNLALVTSSR